MGQRKKKTDYVGKKIRMKFPGYGSKFWTGSITGFDGKAWTVLWEDETETLFSSESKIKKYLCVTEPKAGSEDSFDIPIFSVLDAIKEENMKNLLNNNNLGNLPPLFKKYAISDADYLHLSHSDLMNVGVSSADASRYRVTIEKMLLEIFPHLRQKYSLHAAENGELFYCEKSSNVTSWERPESIEKHLAAAGISFEDTLRRRAEKQKGLGGKQTKETENRRNKARHGNESEDEDIPVTRLNTKKAKKRRRKKGKKNTHGDSPAHQGNEEENSDASTGNHPREQSAEAERENMHDENKTSKRKKMKKSAEEPAFEESIEAGGGDTAEFRIGERVDVYLRGRWWEATVLKESKKGKVYCKLDKKFTPCEVSTEIVRLHNSGESLSHAGGKRKQQMDSASNQKAKRHRDEEDTSPNVNSVNVKNETK